MSSSHDDLLPEFLAEATDILEKVNLHLDGWATSSNRSELLDAVNRGIHTIKGASMMFNFNNTKAVAHALEAFTTSLKANPESVKDSDIMQVRQEVQKIESLLKNKDQLESPLAMAPEASTPSLTPSHEVNSQTHGTTPQVNSGVSSPNSQANGMSPQSSGGVQQGQTDNYIRVPVKKLNDTLNSVSEIFLVRNQMVYLVERLKTGVLEQKDFLQTWEMLDGSMRRGIGDLERSAMGMRMMSVNGLFSRMARVVQSYSAETGKKINFVTHGESTELDKKVLDTLGEPLIHLIRNAMDHGIEPVSERYAQGKPEQGRIILSALLVGNEVVLTIEDDGRGIDSQKILSVAKSKGIDTSKVTDEKSAIELIFEPGFSTAEKVSDISGRGVGMDSVRSSVQALGGRVTISTQVKMGSTFTIRLPVSMSLISSVLVNVNGLIYAIPNHEILETRHILAHEIKVNGKQSYISFRGNYIPCIDVRTLLTQGGEVFEERMRYVSVIIFSKSDKYYAARVSQLENHTEIIVKPTSVLGPNIPFVKGVSVLPTGEPIFVLSVARLIDYCTSGKDHYASAA